MRNSRPIRGATLGAWALAWTLAAPAEAAPAQGFLVERLQATPAGAAWLVLDDLALDGGVGGAVAITGSLAHDPLVVQGKPQLAVVAQQAQVNIGMALTYRRFRLSLDLASPVYLRGQSGTVGGQTYTAPRIDPGTQPDTLTDVRLGLDARLWGEAKGRLRLGLGGHLFLPSADRADYLTDGVVRGVLRLLAAGDLGRLTGAGQVALHLRARHDAAGGVGPQGSELQVGLAAGVRVALGAGPANLVLGPELFGATALSSLLGAETTALEALATVRLEHLGQDGRLLRLKVGAGGGLHARFGAPDWRAVVAVEWLGQAAAPEHRPTIDGPCAPP